MRSNKDSPSTQDELRKAIETGKQVDCRTKAGRAIKDVKKSIRSDLDGTAVALLEENIANCAVVQRLCLEAAFKDPDGAVDSKGNLHQGLNNFLKFQSASKSALLALKKFEKKKPGGLADLLADED